MAKVLNVVETLPKISVAWVGCKNVTDDRRTGDDIYANLNVSSRSIKMMIWKSKCALPVYISNRLLQLNEL